MLFRLLAKLSQRHEHDKEMEISIITNTKMLNRSGEALQFLKFVFVPIEISLLSSQHEKRVGDRSDCVGGSRSFIIKSLQIS